MVAVVHTKGNDKLHVILRGSNTNVNYDAESVEKTKKAMEEKKLDARIVIDCSHSNARDPLPPYKKGFKFQSHALKQIEKIIEKFPEIKGIMLESHVNEGREKEKID